jgi:type VI secretion system protein ImpA
LEAEDGRAKLTEAAIRAAFADTDPDRIEAIRTACATGAADAAAIPAAFDAHAGHGTGPELGELHKLLRDMQRTMDRYAVAQATPPEELPDMPQDSFVLPESQAAPAARPGLVTAASLGPITTRAEAMRLLELVRDYYARYETSSPLPLLIERAMRLADKDFMDILRDLAPDGLGQAQNIAGPRD